MYQCQRPKSSSLMFVHFLAATQLTSAGGCHCSSVTNRKKPGGKSTVKGSLQYLLSHTCRARHRSQPDGIPSQVTQQ